MAIRERNLASAKWSVLSSIKIVGIGVLQLSLLAQILQANELNLLAIAVVILLVIDTLADRGFGNALIRYQSLNNSELSTLYWGNVLSGLFIFAALFIGSDIYSRVMGQPELAIMLEMISVIFIIIPQGQHYRAILQREKQFTRIAFTETSSVLAGLAVTLFTVWLTPSVLCAIWGYLAMVSIRMLIYCYYGRPWFQPEYRFSLKAFAAVRARNG
ncbi:WzxC [Pantoea dispersa EGD-AAK13]|jgi:O-antigen/teichoic acid export membrane protein|uniref:PST family transport protein n=1 Tax=Pantoea dispersa TaxID=59814 RepID=A0A8E1S197_9GAMM|nr:MULTISPECIES: oligosaccharide flippase family protein [Pantoea]MBK4772622.1 oligosaccharide flippase family protein [Pantoea sp. Morm]ERH65711.1 WzxC [Pantoea dispersa EGD-AAK13]KAA6096711.1 oligosaccharide flippase family protein [Pantoea sp. B_9]KAA6114344.1 oligosaccharide flippase family protein [Pantoea sp. B_10]KAA8670593.1 oligosaccharide flippase family protein [Pantoea dispersa]